MSSFTTTRQASRLVGSLSCRAQQQRHFSGTSIQQATWGFIGLGRMGYPMARNLRAKIPKTDELIVHDINEGASKGLSQEIEGVRVASSVREVAEQSETIITALPEPSHVKSVYKSMLEPASLLQSAVSTPRLFIDTSTIDPMTSASVAEAATSSGQGSFIDAPMSGGVVGASAGTLTFMIGAADSLVPRATEILSMMGKKVLHLGPPTSGLKGKLANNYLLALNNIATAEAMNMGVRWGLDPKALAGMINISTGRCWPSEVNNPVPGVIDTAPASRGYEGGFGIALMKKDLGLALKACEEFDIKLGLGAQAAKLYDEAAADEQCRGRDFSVIYRYLGGKE